MEKSNFIGFDHGNGKMMINGEHGFIFAKPIELHLKRDGSIEDKESFAIVMEVFTKQKIVGEISLKMLNEAFEDVGYKIVEK